MACHRATGPFCQGSVCLQDIHMHSTCVICLHVARLLELYSRIGESQFVSACNMHAYANALHVMHRYATDCCKQSFE